MATDRRTKKDEDSYNANLRREERIKTEVIVELRDQNRALWKTQATLLRALIEAEDALRVYRLHALEAATRIENTESRCVHGCTKHVWKDADGWHRADEKDPT